MRIAGALIVLAGLSASAAALAAPPPWSNSRHNRSYDDGYDYASVTRVEPIGPLRCLPILISAEPFVGV